ncbi:MAG: hypothetical protein RR398_03145 [Clostridia bacterium]
MSQKTIFSRIVALALALVMLTIVFSACSVVISDPAVLKVGDVTIYYSQYVNQYNQYYQMYTQYKMYDVSTEEKLVEFQDLVYDSLFTYAVCLYQAHQQNLVLDEKENKTVDIQVQDAMDELYANAFDALRKVPLADLEAGYPLTAEQEPAAQKTADEKYAERLETYKTKIDAALTNPDEIKAAEEALLLEELKKSTSKTAPTTIDEFKKSLLDDARYALLMDNLIAANPPTAEDEATVEAKVQKKYDAKLATYASKVDAKITEEEEIKAEEEKLLIAELEKSEKTIESYKEELTKEVRDDISLGKVIGEKANEDMLKSLKDNKYTLESYKAKYKEQAENDILVQKVQDNIKNAVTLDENDAHAWYDTQVKTLQDKYATDSSSFKTDQEAYDKDPTGMPPIVIPDGFIRVKHILLPTPSPVPTVDPAATQNPNASVAPSATVNPSATVDPSATVNPSATVDPSATVNPSATANPSATVNPSATANPSATVVPSATVAPTATTPTPTQFLTRTPSPTHTPNPSATPATTSTPGPTVDPALVAEVQAKIDEINNGTTDTTFADLIKLYGKDPGMDSDPYLTYGYLVSDSTMSGYTAGFGETALALTTVGEISAPVYTSFGVHFIQLIDIIEPGVVPYENIQTLIEKKVLDEKKTTVYDEAIAKWKKECPITKYESRIRTVGMNTMPTPTIKPVKIG